MYNLSRYCRAGLLALLLALTALAGLPSTLRAQYVSQAAVGARVGPHSYGQLRSPALLPAIAPEDSARRSVVPFLVGGAVAGALVGGLLAASFNDSYCGEPAPGVTCSSTSPAAGAALGAGIGLLAGWFLWALSTPASPAPLGDSR